MSSPIELYARHVKAAHAALQRAAAGPSSDALEEAAWALFRAFGRSEQVKTACCGSAEWDERSGLLADVEHAVRAFSEAFVMHECGADVIDDDRMEWHKEKLGELCRKLAPLTAVAEAALAECQ